MEYNWKYANISSSRAFKVWKDWNAQYKLAFLNQCKHDFSNKLRLFACWSIEQIIGKEYLENDSESSLNIAKKVAKGKIGKQKLLAAKGRYRTPEDYDNLRYNLKADVRMGPDQKNINWLRIMNNLCEVDAYNSTAYIIWLLEGYIAQERFNCLYNEDITYTMAGTIMRANHWHMEEIYNTELERRFSHIFDEKEIEIFIKPNKICYDLRVAPYIEIYPESNSMVEEWNYRAWAFCVDNDIIR